MENVRNAEIKLKVKAEIESCLCVCVYVCAIIITKNVGRGGRQTQSERGRSNTYAAFLCIISFFGMPLLSLFHTQPHLNILLLCGKFLHFLFL